MRDPLAELAVHPSEGGQPLVLGALDRGRVLVAPVEGVVTPGNTGHDSLALSHTRDHVVELLAQVVVDVTSTRSRRGQAGLLQRPAASAG